MWATAGVTGDIIYISYISCVTAWWQKFKQACCICKICIVNGIPYISHTAAAEAARTDFKRPIIRSRTTFIYSYHIIYTYTTINFAGYDESIDTFITIIAQHNNCISMCSRCCGLVFYCKI